MYRWWSGLLCYVVAQMAFAIDPIAWTLTDPFPSPVYTTGTYIATYTLTNQLPLTLVNPLVIEKFGIPVADFSFTDNCTGERLASGGTCTVAINLTPSSSGQKQAGLLITGYDFNRVPLPIVVASVSGTTPTTITGVVSTPLPSPLVVNNTGNFTVTFTNGAGATATGIAVSAANTTNFNSSCCPTSLAPSASCSCSGSFTPTSSTPSTQGVVVQLTYVQGSDVSVPVTTQVSSDGLSISASTALPGITAHNTSYPAAFKVTNNGSSTITFTGAPTAVVSPVGPVFTQDGGGQCGTSLTGGGTCNITGSLATGVSTGFYQLTATVTPTVGSAVSAVTGTTIQSSTALVRTFVLNNECAFPVWFSFNGGSVTGSSCTTTADCPSGSACNANSGFCYWNNYAPTNNGGSFMLAANTGTATVEIPIPAGLSAATDIVWSGALSARTGCDTTPSCVTAGCGTTTGDAACPAGVGFNQPATQAEFTLQNNVDTYDIEVINGFHIPIKMSPGSGTPNGYSCGSPGNLTATNGFGACNWNNAVPIANSFYRVTSGGSSCTTQADCSSDTICGLDDTITLRCGNFLGYWSANQACSKNSTNAQQFFGCNNYLGSPYPANSYQMTNLYLCNAGLQSCYNTSDTQCCGCANWYEASPPVTLPTTTPCDTTGNTIWVNQVQPGLQWMKEACAMVYTYPFDDKSSTFTCGNGSPNLTEYTVTFCPGGVSGLPTGKTDGRGT